MIYGPCPIEDVDDDVVAGRENSILYRKGKEVENLGPEVGGALVLDVTHPRLGVPGSDVRAMDATARAAEALDDDLLSASTTTRAPFLASAPAADCMLSTGVSELSRELCSLEI